jgi:hypothetical protein
MKTATLLIAAAVLTVSCGRNDSQTSKMTLNGCLQAGEQGLAPNDAARPADADRFVLADSSNPAAPLYVLDGKADELRSLLGQQVEITGELKGGADAASANPRNFDVDSVRMIAATCNR